MFSYTRVHALIFSQACKRPDEPCVLITYLHTRIYTHTHTHIPPVFVHTCPYTYFFGRRASALTSRASLSHIFTHIYTHTHTHSSCFRTHVFMHLFFGRRASALTSRASLSHICTHTYTHTRTHSSCFRTHVFMHLFFGRRASALTSRASLWQRPPTWL